MPIEIIWNEGALALKKKKELELAVRNKAFAKKRASDEIEHQEKADFGFFDNQTRLQSTSDEAKEANALDCELVRKAKKLQLREVYKQVSIGYQGNANLAHEYTLES